jgi:hypothetical protein
MVADHERLLDEHAGVVAGHDQPAGLLGGQRDGLLAEHVLARGCGLDRDRHVQVVG